MNSILYSLFRGFVTDFDRKPRKRTLRISFRERVPLYLSDLTATSFPQHPLSPLSYPLSTAPLSLFLSTPPIPPNQPFLLPHKKVLNGA